MFETPTTRVWKELYDRGALRPPQSFFWETKPPEELYDLLADPDEVDNLAGSPEHETALSRLRRAQQTHARRIRDVGFLPEAEIHTRSESEYPMRRVMEVAELAASFDEDAIAPLARALDDPDSAVRFWAAQGLLARGIVDGLSARLTDTSPSVRAVAAEALGRYGNGEQRGEALDALIDLASLDRYEIYVVMLALNALDAMDEKAASIEGANPCTADVPPLGGPHDAKLRTATHRKNPPRSGLELKIEV